jgi:hypothetical protein
MVKKALCVLGIAVAVLAFLFVAAVFALNLYILDGTAPDWLPSWFTGVPKEAAEW